MKMKKIPAFSFVPSVFFVATTPLPEFGKFQSWKWVEVISFLLQWPFLHLGRSSLAMFFSS